MAQIIGYIPAARNLIWNPSFEADLSQWSGQDATIARVNTWAAVGSWALEVTCSIVSPTPNTYHATTIIPALPAKRYSARAMARTVTASRVCWFQIFFYNSSFATLQVSQSTPVPLVPNQNTLVKAEGIESPALTAFTTMQIIFGVNGGGNVPVGNKFLVDGVQLTQTDADISYIDGSMGAGYSWVGTAHNSASDRVAKPIYGASGRDGHILIEPQLFKTSKLNSIGEEISSSILSGLIDMRTDREIKTQMKGTLHGINPVLAYTDYIAPFLRLIYPDGVEVYEQLGVYSIAPPGETWNEDYVLGDFQAYDLTWNLQDSSFGIPFTVAAGTNIVQSMRNILNNEGFTRWLIPDHAATFTAARTWETDKSKLAILNDHAEAIGYYTLSADSIGQMQSFPYNDLGSVEPATRLFSGSGSTVIGAIRRERLPEGIVNMVRVIKEGGSESTISYTQTNSNPISPVSTTTLGRIKFKEIKVRDLASLAVAKDIARKALSDAASLYTKYQITTLPDPQRGIWETYDTDIQMIDGTEVIRGLVRCTGWDIGFTPQQAAMTHYCSRMEAYE